MGFFNERALLSAANGPGGLGFGAKGSGSFRSLGFSCSFKVEGSSVLPFPEASAEDARTPQQLHTGVSGCKSG